MWAYYAEGFSGLSIGLDLFSFNKIGEINKVIYSDMRVPYGIDEILEPSNTSFFKELSITKSIEWMHEDEYRMFYVLEDRDCVIEQFGKYLLVPITSDMVKEVIIGKKISPQGLTDHKRILDEERYSHVKLFSVRPANDGTFKLIKEPFEF